MDAPFHIIKKILVIRESCYPYDIDDDGHGVAWIDQYKLTFIVNKYGEILIGTIKCDIVRKLGFLNPQCPVIGTPIK